MVATMSHLPLMVLLFQELEPHHLNSRRTPIAVSLHMLFPRLPLSMTAMVGETMMMSMTEDSRETEGRIVTLEELEFKSYM